MVDPLKSIVSRKILGNHNVGSRCMRSIRAPNDTYFILLHGSCVKGNLSNNYTAYSVDCLKPKTRIKNQHLRTSHGQLSGRPGSREVKSERRSLLL